MSVVPDFLFVNHGSLWLVQPANADLKQHLLDNVSDEAQWFCGQLAVEYRYIAPLAQQLLDEGFSVNMDWG